MAKTQNDVCFNLKSSNTNTKTLIYLIYRLKNGERLKYSTGEKILPAFWNNETKRALVKGDAKQKEISKSVNLQLGRYEEIIGKILSHIEREKINTTIEFFRTELDKEFKLENVKDKNLKETDLVEYAIRYIDECRSGTRLNKDNDRYSIGTCKQYQTTCKVLQDFATDYKRTKFEQLDIDFYKKFVNFLATKKQYAKNSVGTAIKNTKIFIKESYNDGLHSNLIFRNPDFKKTSEEVVNIYLNDDELQTLFDYDFSHKPRLDRARDLFLIGCYTGLRFSDFSHLTHDNITHEGQILTVFTKKTGVQVSIPINPQLQAILNKYGGVPPRAISNQRMNDYLKEIGQLIELTDSVQIAKTVGGLKVTKTFKKWQKLCTHTARRSFATNAYLAGISTIDIMCITSHKTESSFLKYIKITSEETAKRLQMHDHFKKPTMKVA
jgi:site-specific recombinase XerD